MNNPTPLPDELRDELLSAELDDDFDAAATDLGLDPAEAQARLEATPGIDARRDAMREARALLQPPPEIDELVAARLRTKALNEARAVNENDKARRARRRYSVLGGIAAALVLVVGVVFALNQSTSSHTDSSKVATEAPQASGGALTNGGESAASFNLLANSVRAKLAADRRANAPAAAKRAQGNFGTSATGGTTATSKCEPAASQVAGPAIEKFSGEATVDGQPVVYFGYAQGKSDVVVILTADCAFLRHEVTPAP
jgi:hypothetical protein